LVYGIISGGGHFNDDAAQLPDQIKHPTAPLRAGARPMLLAAGPADQPIPFSDLIVTVMVVVRAGQLLLGFLVDAEFVETFGRSVDPVRNKLIIIKSLIGIANTALNSLSLTARLQHLIGSGED